MKIEHSLYSAITDWKTPILNIEKYLDCDAPFSQFANSASAKQNVEKWKIFMVKITLLKTDYTLYIEKADLKIPIVNIEKYLNFESPLT